MSTQTIAIIGGSGLYDAGSSDLIETLTIETPYGSPSGPIERVRLGDHSCLFLPRHGKGHSVLPHEVNYRANIFALKTLGVTHCVSINACGSLQESLRPGDLVIPNMLIDFSSRRQCSFFGDGIIAHPSFADPFCHTLHTRLQEFFTTYVDHSFSGIHAAATYLCIDGPGFSTRAESHMFRQWGASLIGMTLATEAKLAREAEIALCSLCLVSDYDCWKEYEDSVDAHNALAVLRASTATIQKLLPELLKHLNAAPMHSTAHTALDHALLTRGKDLEAYPERHPLLQRFLDSA